MWSCTVFGFFRPYFDVVERRHLYSFVEQIKLYRLVYDSILMEKKSKETKPKGKKLIFSHLFEKF
jgi:hypothetical protein